MSGGPALLIMRRYRGASYLRPGSVWTLDLSEMLRRFILWAFSTQRRADEDAGEWIGPASDDLFDLASLQLHEMKQQFARGEYQA